MSDSLAQLAWLDRDNPLDEIFCVSFVHRLDPPEVLRRFGAIAPGEEQMTFDSLIGLVGKYVEQTYGGNGGGYVGVVRPGEWSVAIEPWGWQGTLLDVITGLSLSSEVVAINRHDYAEHEFVYSVDGTIITAFAPRMRGLQHGSEPQRLIPLMREVGLAPQQDNEPVQNPIAAAFALAAKITGVVFTPHMLNQPLLVGDIRN